MYCIMLYKWHKTIHLHTNRQTKKITVFKKKKKKKQLILLGFARSPGHTRAYIILLYYTKIRRRLFNTCASHGDGYRDGTSLINGEETRLIWMGREVLTAAVHTCTQTHRTTTTITMCVCVYSIWCICIHNLSIYSNRYKAAMESQETHCIKKKK
jgi:hypothetical protein